MIRTFQAYFVAVLMLLSADAVQSQNLTIHPRVGQELDAFERTYFNLFATWPEGEVIMLPAQGDSVRFVHTQLAEIQLVKSGEELATLVDYLDHMEDVDYLMEFINWNHLVQLANFRHRFQRGSSAVFVSMNGEVTEGSLLYATEARLWALKGNGAYNWKEFKESVFPVQASVLAHIEHRRSSLSAVNRSTLAVLASLGPTLLDVRSVGLGDATWMAASAFTAMAGLRWGFSAIRVPIAGSTTRLENAATQLSGASAFKDDLIPPELTLAMAKPGQGSLFLEPEGSALRWHPARTYLIGSQFLFPVSRQEAFMATGFGLEKPKRRTTPWLRAEIGQDLNQKWSTGAELLLALRPKPHPEFVSYHGQALTWYGDWYLQRPDLLTFVRRWSLSAGLGLSLVHLQSSTGTDWSTIIKNQAPEVANQSAIKRDKWGLAPQIRITASYALDPESALQFRASLWIPPVTLDEDNYNLGGSTIYGFNSFSLPIGLGLGLIRRLSD